MAPSCLTDGGGQCRATFKIVPRLLTLLPCSFQNENKQWAAVRVLNYDGEKSKPHTDVKSESCSPDCCLLAVHQKVIGVHYGSSFSISSCVLPHVISRRNVWMLHLYYVLPALNTEQSSLS